VNYLAATDISCKNFNPGISNKSYINCVSSDGGPNSAAAPSPH